MADLENAASLLAQLKNERFSGVCRCCLAAGNFLSMYYPCGIVTEKDDYFDVIMTCFNVNLVESIEDRDNILYLVCDDCSSRLRESYTFKCQIVDAQKSFQSIVKIEVTDPVVMKEESEDYFQDFSDAGQDSTDAEDDTPLAMVTKHKSRKQKKSKRKKRKGKGSPKVSLTKSNAQMDREVQDSLDQENLQCRICHETFHNSYLLRMHVNIHYPNHICEICGKGHATHNRLRNHQRMHITGSFTCADCGKVFTSKGKFDNHRGHHLMPLRHLCPKCPVRFSSHYQRQKHLAETHAEILKRYTCDQCPKDFTTSGSLFNHKKRNHLKLKTHVCVQCEKAFYHKSELNDHMVVHTRERKFLCTVCLKTYPRACTLREHMKIHNNVKNHVCSECGRAFTQKCTLRGHMKVHEKITKIALNLPDES